MNEIVETAGTKMTEVHVSSGGSGMKIAPTNLAEVVKFADVMARGGIALPPHLRGEVGACMAVAIQALEWQMSPFAVASKSYVVKGAIAYEAQLIIAVINTRSGIEGRLEYEFEGEGGEMVCIAKGVIGGKEREVRSPMFKDIQPKNSPLWKSDPAQQLCYYTGRSWGRRHCPEVILGVYDRDEAEQFAEPRDVTPNTAERLKANHVATDEGHDHASLTDETNSVMKSERKKLDHTKVHDVEVIDGVTFVKDDVVVDEDDKIVEPDTDDQVAEAEAEDLIEENSEADVPPTTSSAEEQSPEEPEDAATSGGPSEGDTAEEAPVASADKDVAASDAGAAASDELTELGWVRECTKMLWAGTHKGQFDVFAAQWANVKDEWPAPPEVSKETMAKLRRVFNTCQSYVKGEIDVEQTMKAINTETGISTTELKKL